MQLARDALQLCANGEEDVMLTREALASLDAALSDPPPYNCSPSIIIFGRTPYTIDEFKAKAQQDGTFPLLHQPLTTGGTQ